MPEDDESPLTWEELAQKLQVETDPVKIVELARKLNEALLDEERQRFRKRFGDKKNPQNELNNFMCPPDLTFNPAWKNQRNGKGRRQPFEVPYD